MRLHKAFISPSLQAHNNSTSLTSDQCWENCPSSSQGMCREIDLGPMPFFVKFSLYSYNVSFLANFTSQLWWFLHSYKINSEHIKVWEWDVTHSVPLFLYRCRKVQCCCVSQHGSGRTLGKGRPDSMSQLIWLGVQFFLLWPCIYRMVGNFCGYKFLRNRPKFRFQKFSQF